MDKEQQLQDGASYDFSRSTNSDVAPQITQQVSSPSSHQGGQPHEQQADLMASTDVEPAQQTAPQKEQNSPFLSILMQRGIAVTVARELLKENQELAVKAEKHDKHRQQVRDSYFRQKEADPQGMREKWRVTKAQQRAQKRQEAQAQEVQKTTG